MNLEELYQLAQVSSYSDFRAEVDNQMTNTPSTVISGNQFVLKLVKKRKRWHHHKLYQTWHNMKQKCYSEKHKRYNTHGAIGIIVCDSWKNDFVAFCDYFGDRPTPDHSILRIDSNKNYTPANCRWGTRAEQSTRRKFLSPRNKSGHRGIVRNHNQWAIVLSNKGKKIYVGYTDSLVEAVKIKDRYIKDNGLVQYINQKELC